MLNWETEFKRWCPRFKILTYYGSQKVGNLPVSSFVLVLFSKLICMRYRNES
jgi:SNF2 family DNA or RNA helicase